MSCLLSPLNKNVRKTHFKLSHQWHSLPHGTIKANYLIGLKNLNFYLFVYEGTRHWHWMGLRKDRRHKGPGGCKAATAVVSGLRNPNCGCKPICKRSRVNMERAAGVTWEGEMTGDDALRLGSSSCWYQQGLSSSKQYLRDLSWREGEPVWKGCNWLQARGNDGSSRSEQNTSLMEQRAWELCRKQHKEMSTGKLSWEEPCVWREEAWRRDLVLQGSSWPGKHKTLLSNWAGNCRVPQEWTTGPQWLCLIFRLPFAAPLCSSLVWLWSICGVCFSLLHSTFSLSFYVLNCYSAVLI